MFKLDKYKIGRILEELADTPEYLDIWLPYFNNKEALLEDRKDSVFQLTDILVDNALGLYALGRLAEVRPYFEQAAPYAFLRGFDPELRTHNNEWTIQEELNICLLFANEDTAAKLKQLALPFKIGSITQRSIDCYNQLLIKAGTGQALQIDELELTIAEAKATKDKDVQQYIVSLLEALLAIETANQDMWQSSIAKAVKWHADECQFGSLKDLGKFICFNALTLAKLGKDRHNWQCQTDSVYLPLFLID
ncbi:hypothetical protein [Shewanella baltica]|uniref:hypothetical protein n=1 Tax=Shewanella baltica TaxID=62322 RepID=UPI00217CE44E|nr:hypothetical protein [Shewanella baltica]MCS6123672.1 hypothetical protein [Shewanella baltica]